MAGRWPWGLALVGALLAVPAVAAGAKPGTLDRHFGNYSGQHGYAFVAGDRYPSGSVDALAGMTLGAGNTIILGGTGNSGGSAPGNLLAARLTSRGKIDTTFGNTASNHVSEGDVSGDDQMRGVASDLAGNIYMVGESDADTTPNSLGIAKLQPNGFFDLGFNATGHRTVNVTPGNDSEANAVAVQADGKAVAVGAATTASNDSLALVRFRTDGTLDPSFNGTGEVVTDASGQGQPSTGQAIAVQHDGRILVAGTIELGPKVRVFVARYKGNGTLDHSFGHGGIERLPGSDFASSIAVARDGKIIVSGFGRVARLKPNGSLDKGFGKRGITRVSFDGYLTAVRSVALERDGKIVLGGIAADLFPGGTAAVAALKPDGRPDRAFGHDGAVLFGIGLTPIGSGFSFGTAPGAEVAVQQDGKVVAADAYTFEGQSGFLVTRLHGP